MSKKNLPYKVTGILALLAVASATGLADSFLPSGDDGQLTRDAEQSPLRSQIRADIRRSFQVLDESTSLADWRESGFTPEDILKNTAALKSQESWKALCATLRGLSESDLAFFGDAIEKYKSSPDFDCAAPLISVVQGYWVKKELELKLRRAATRNQGGDKNEGGSRPNPAFRPSSPALLPSEERVIDPALVHGTSDGGLKPGEIAITLDDGPHPTRSGRILDILRDYGVRVTYFEIGQNAKEFPAVSREIVAAGHTLGSHSLDHANLPKMALKNAEQDISFGRDEVTNAGGVSIPFFRFPYGASSQALRDYVAEQGMTHFLWNMDSLDWKIHDPEALFGNVLKELNREKGGIILFHDIHEQTVIVMPHLLDELQKRGFKTIVFVPPQRR